jgi:hypothetical protein
MALKLRQGQVWKRGREFIRIVRLERLEVGYKTIANLKTGEGEHHHTSKKDFCRLLKNCRLLSSKSSLPDGEEPSSVQAPDQV